MRVFVVVFEFCFISCIFLKKKTTVIIILVIFLKKFIFTVMCLGFMHSVIIVESFQSSFSIELSFSTVNLTSFKGHVSVCARLIDIQLPNV